MFDAIFFVVTAANIVLLGMEYDGQPDALTTFLYYSNIVITFIFFFEFIVKWDLARDHLLLDRVATQQTRLHRRPGRSARVLLSSSNQLDIIRIVRVFRMFRIFRVLQVVGRFDSLSKLVEVGIGSLHDISYTGAFLALFVILYVTMGMYIFGDTFQQWRLQPDGT